VSPTQRLVLLGALWALPLAVPLVFIDSISDGAGNGLWVLGVFGLPFATTAIQAREARDAARRGYRSAARPVLRATLAFFGGATFVLFIAFVPVARILGTFEIVEGTSYAGELFFLFLEVAAATWMLASGAAVTALAAGARRIKRR
jgi:hypothetical protein